MIEQPRAVHATPELIKGMLGKLRIEDQIECMAMGAKDADSALVDGYERSTQCFVGVVEGEPVLAFGVAPRTLLKICGVPWMLATEKITSVSLRVVRQSKVFIKRFLDEFESLENYVHAENKISIQWLRWCGFNIEPAEPFGPKKELFHRFWMRRV